MNLKWFPNIVQHFYRLLHFSVCALQKTSTESGRGSITLRDVARLAAVHDFTWNEKEMADMIYCFDSDGDGKVGTCFALLRNDGATYSYMCGFYYYV